MTEQEIKDFIKSNTDERIGEYFNLILAKLNLASKRNEYLSFIMVILVVLYFIVDKNIISDLSVGPVTLVDVSVTKMFIPLLFAFVLLLFATINAHRADIIQNIREIGVNYFNLRQEEKQEFYSNPFLQLLMPFSFWEEINTKNLNGGAGCLTLLMTIPLYPIIAAPFVFEYHAIKSLINERWDNGNWDKVLIIFTVWMVLSSIVYYFRLFRMKIKEQLKTE